MTAYAMGEAFHSICRGAHILAYCIKVTFEQSQSFSCYQAVITSKLYE